MKPDESLRHYQRAFHPSHSQSGWIHPSVRLNPIFHRCFPCLSLASFSLVFWSVSCMLVPLFRSLSLPPFFEFIFGLTFSFCFFFICFLICSQLFCHNELSFWNSCSSFDRFFVGLRTFSYASRSLIFSSFHFAVFSWFFYGFVSRFATGV